MQVLARVAAALFVAWFLAVSVLATPTAAAVTRSLAQASAMRDAPARPGAEATPEAPSGASREGTAQTTVESSPAGGDAEIALAPPGDDVPPELEVDLENEPGHLSSGLAWPARQSTLVTFVLRTDALATHEPASSSPPPRA